jgi:hypothetical protein
MKDVHITLNVKGVDVRLVQDGRKRTNGIVNFKDVDVLILQYGRKRMND